MQEFVLMNDSTTADNAHELAAKGLTREHELALTGIGLGALIGKIGLMAVQDINTGEKRAAIVACPPDGLEDEPVIPLAILIEGDPFAQYAPFGADLETYRQAA
jgi:hypothetical protein